MVIRGLIVNKDKTPPKEIALSIGRITCENQSEFVQIEIAGTENTVNPLLRVELSLEDFAMLITGRSGVHGNAIIYKQSIKKELKL